jgi:putative selenium metabolism protein SsnA
MLIKNIRTFTLAPAQLRNTNLRITGSEITAEDPSLVPLKNEEVVDLEGKLVLPGFVNAHTHLYSSLSRGMPMPARAPANFTEILEKIWWKLDVSLDEETIYYSALVGAIDAIKCGTTTLVDHHASPSSITGSLDLIKKALKQVGIRGVLCYEVTDRGGKKKRDEGLEENERFIEGNKTDEYFRGYVGAHAAFTLSDESLHLCGEMAAKHNTGVHIHVSEDACEVKDAGEKYKSTVFDRLAPHKILTKESILAHCVHLTLSEFKTSNEEECWLVHNPRSNMNNRVGYAKVHLFGEKLALGTDGFPADMLEEAKFAFHKKRDSRVDENINYVNLITGGQKLISGIFGRKFGTFDKGATADLVVMNYNEPTPMEKDNLLGHYLFGMQSSMVESVMVGGKWVMQNRKIPGIDENKIFAKSRQLARKLWMKMGEEH